MRVLILQLDGSFPNLALMRLSAHHKANGDSIEFRRAPTIDSVERGLFDDHERIYASTIFDPEHGRGREIADRLRALRPDAIIGGTGMPAPTKTQSLSEMLTDVAEATTAKTIDYAIAPKFTASIGFTQRGCRLKCKFCVVPGKEGKVSEVAAPREVWRGEPWPRNLLLLDNDFFGQPSWREHVRELREGGFRVCLTQGINARLIDDEQAAALASLDYRDARFRERRLFTAWDNLGDGERLFTNLEALKRAGVRPRSITVYMLIGFWGGETHEMREERRRRIREFGAAPYPMPYVRTPELLAYQRWCVLQRDTTVAWSEWIAARANPRIAARRHMRRSLPVLPGFEKECG